MKKSLLLLAVFSMGCFTLKAQEPVAYKIYNAKGKKQSFQKLIKGALRADIVFFGELHNNPIAHWLQLELAKKLHEKKPLVLGAEMFEADNQEALSAYVNGLSDAQTFEQSVRLWENYKTDYKPLVDFARNQQLTFIATNVPRNYATMVYRNGLKPLDSLSETEKAWMAPLPIFVDRSLSTYQEMSTTSGHGGENLINAQALKDATMAYFIMKNWQPGNLFLHFNGSYHSKRHEGMVWQLRIKRPDLKLLTIATVEQENLDKMEIQFIDEADFIIVIPKNMTKTY